MSRKRRRSKGRFIVLGPQLGSPTLPGVCEELENEGILTPSGSIATVTAGWQEREGELERLEVDLGRPVLDLGLYARAEDVGRADPELRVGHRAVQNRLKELRRAYNKRLAGSIDTLAEITALTGDETIIGPEREDALAQIRHLDVRHLERVLEVRAEYEETFAPESREAVVSHRAELGELLGEVEAVALAGGHVATLLNRLRLFGLGGLLEGRTIIAWSAGAMVLTPRIALFHDRPPWGPGNPEVFEHGLGLVKDVVFFPHATRRLALNDAVRTGRLAARFAPDTCVLLDPGTRIDSAADGWVGKTAARCLDRGGAPGPFAARAA